MRIIKLQVHIIEIGARQPVLEADMSRVCVSYPAAVDWSRQICRPQVQYSTVQYSVHFYRNEHGFNWTG